MTPDRATRRWIPLWHSGWVCFAAYLVAGFCASVGRLEITQAWQFNSPILATTMIVGALIATSCALLASRTAAAAFLFFPAALIAAHIAAGGAYHGLSGCESLGSPIDCPPILDEELLLMLAIPIAVAVLVISLVRAAHRAGACQLASKVTK